PGSWTAALIEPNRGNAMAMNRSMRRQMKQMQGLQAMLAKAQEELAEKTVEASAGGGAVTVVMTGQQKVKSIKISPEVVDAAEVEMLEDLVTAAVSEAIDRSQGMASEHLGGLTGGLNLPGLT
ncbi:MAG: YbaB/EbfC family nucleoid-associated protein, partial [Dehalococcoidia bacterium]